MDIGIPRFGPHNYPYDGGTSDCSYGCGCWMGPYRSGGPGRVDPFGECPNNPRGIILTKLDDKVINASEMGKLGGKARAASMTAKRRSEIAKKASLARWAKYRKEKGQS